MFSLRKPSPEALIETLEAVGREPFRYPEVGATRDDRPLLPDGRYDVDRNQRVLGHGRPLFERARAALLRWQHFSLPWLVRVGPPEVHEGAVTGVLVHVAGLWSFNPCRVVYVLGAEEATRAGFAYGTLAGHAELGEERFLVDFDEDSEAVRFEILAFSRAAHPLSRIGRPIARRVQRRFALAALQALEDAVAERSPARA